MERGEIELITIQKKPYFGGHYRLEYDGKYVTLLGWDLTYPVFNIMAGENADNTVPTEFEEMVLIPVVYERRYIKAEIMAESADSILIRIEKI